MRRDDRLPAERGGVHDRRLKILLAAQRAGGSDERDARACGKGRWKLHVAQRRERFRAVQRRVSSTDDV
jgi:hypothetical protein